jgi:hypothetical protein
LNESLAKQNSDIPQQRRSDVPVDPQEHADGRGVVETILRYIPGFRGYLEKGYRRESDQLQRNWLADQLRKSKQGIDDYAGNLARQGQIDQLSECDRLRNRLDGVITKLIAAVQGYSGFFDFVQVNEELLDDVYDHDAAMMKDVETLAEAIRNLATSTQPPAAAVADLLAQLNSIVQQVDGRDALLQGLAESD